MLFGFTLIAIFYYLGKVNDQKKETLRVFLEFMEGPSEILNLMTRFADELKPFVNKMPPAILKGWFSESLLRYGEDTTALRQELQSNYHLLRSSFEQIASSVKFDAYRLIFLFSLSLLLCFIGLFYTVIGYGGSVWFYIALVLISITSAIYSFIVAWNRLQTLSNDLDNDFISLQAASRIYGKIARDIELPTNSN